MSAVGDAHLHNEPDLLRLLNCSPDPANVSISLVLKAWQKWGHECPQYVSGEYSFAVYDHRARRLFLCRDHMGAKPLFYWRHGSKFAFAADPVQLLKFPGIPRRLNRAKLAGMAVLDGLHFRPDDTLHEGIMAMGPATVLSVDRDGLREHRYWWPAASPARIPRRSEEAFEALRELIFRAVGNRIRGARSVSVYLSGGMDSAAVAAVASWCLARSNQNLVAIGGVVPPGNAQFPDEREFIDQFQGLPNIRTELVTAEGRGPFDFIHRPELFEPSFTHSSRHYLTEELDRRAAQAGSDVALAGFRGELGLTSKGAGYYTELAWRLQWIRLLSKLTAARARTGVNPLRLFAADVRGQLFPRHVWQGSYAFLTPEFARECDARPLRFRHWPDHRARQLEEILLMQRKHGLNDWSLTHPIVPVQSPLYDRHILEFCLSAPGHMKIRDGYSRYLMRGALRGIVPDRILWRTDKKPYAPDYSARYNAQLPIARAFVAEISPKDPVRSIVDVSRLERSMVPVDPAVGSYDSLVHVPSTIYLICFLRQFADFRA